MFLYLRYIVNQLFVCRLAKMLAFVQLRMSAPVRKISKVHSVSSPRTKVAMISHPLRWTRRSFVTGHWNAYRPATMVSLSPMEKRNWKWLATLEVGYTVSSRRESFRKFLIVYVITYNCLIIVHQATTQFLVSVIPYDRFPQTYAIHLAQTEEDAWLTTFVSVPKGSEDRNAITVGAFDFNRVKKKHALFLVVSTVFVTQFCLHNLICCPIETFTAVENCAPERMGFNGVYNCSCGSSSLSCCVLCSLNCGTDGVFEFPPAPVYSCEYAEAKFFPETVPQCIFGKILKWWWSFVNISLLYFMIWNLLIAENQEQQQPVQYFKSNSTSHSQMVIMQTSNMEWTGKETSNQETDFSVVSNGFQGFLGFIPKNRILNSEKDNFKATRDILGKSMHSNTKSSPNFFPKRYHYDKSAPPYKNWLFLNSNIVLTYSPVVLHCFD